VICPYSPSQERKVYDYVYFIFLKVVYQGNGKVVSVMHRWLAAEVMQINMGQQQQVDMGRRL
jgi:hypothetical protein